MTAHPRRIRLSAATAALCGLAAVAVTACAASPAAASQAAAASSATASQQHGIAPMGLPSVISCTRQAQIRPGRYTLACADGNAYLTGLYWAAWGSDSAFATGTDAFNVCVPTCPAGHLHSYPVLAVLWRAEPLPGHPGERYFTRLTIIDTGPVSYHTGGKTYHLPGTVTDPLVPTGGA